MPSTRRCEKTKTMYRPQLAVIALAIAALSGCSEAQSERCRDVCQQETECAAKSGEASDDGFKYDQDECIAACVALERDPDGKMLVDKHIECAKKAGTSCASLLQCR